MKKEPSTWVCGACGREGVSREELRKRDVSCGTWAAEVYVSSLKRNAQGQIIEATAVSR